MIFKKFFGFVVKIGYAFLYQEYLVNVPFLYKPVPLWIGGLLMPHVNRLINTWAEEPQTDDYVVNSRNLYPG